jgi:hypothetical protein
MFVRVVIISAALISFVGCSSTATSPSEPSSLAGPSGISELPRAVPPSGTVARAVGSGRVVVNMNDNCDPETFNAAIGPGTCIGKGGMTFDQFIAQLTKLGFVGSWHFAPRVVNAHAGKEFLVINRGGETHTFTEVEEFGGGIVPLLNDLAGVPNVAPECLSLGPDAFVAPGQTFTEDIEQDEAEHYQCCIHPWMRLSTRVHEER